MAVSNKDIDLVAWPLRSAVNELARLKLVYKVDYTKPDRSVFSLDHENFYVVRQRVDDTGSHHLIAAVKMGKEA